MYKATQAALTALLTLILSACSTTTQTVALKPQIDAALRVACAPLPLLDVAIGTDLREAVLRNRIESEAVHDECAAKHRAVLNAIGIAPIETTREKQ